MLVGVPVGFNGAFALLASRFDYPDILRRPTTEVLERFRQGGTSLVMIWWAFAMTAVLFAPLVVLVSATLAGADATLLVLATTVGVVAAAVQFLGLIRWPFLVPYLARESAGLPAGSSRSEAIDVVFQSFNRYLGVAVGEHLGFALTGIWSVLAGAAMVQSDALASWLGVAGIIVGAGLLVCSFEFVGRHEPAGWRFAGRLTPIAYVLWSLWLITVGVALLT
jgi:hypothetical protein